MTSDWPAGAPRPLAGAQEPMVRELGDLQRRPHGVRVLAVLKCWKCGQPVGDLRMFTLSGDDGVMREWRGGAVLTGTQRRDPEAVRRELEVVHEPYVQRRNVPGTDQYTALVTRAGLPPRLPFWCERHGPLAYSWSALRADVPQAEAAPAALTLRVRPEST